MTTIQLIAVPYDSGHRGERMGAGPEYFLNKKVPELVQYISIVAAAEEPSLRHFPSIDRFVA